MSARADQVWPHVDPDEFREALGQFATGVTVVTAGGDMAHGMTANAFASVSLDPPMVLVCVKNSARLNECVAHTGCFGVSILAEEQQAAACHFANSSRPEGDEQFDRFDCHEGPLTSAPLVGGALAWLECEVVEIFPGGDHHIYLGRVLTCSTRPSSSPLTFYAGEFTSIDRSRAS
ncbi:MAG: flavin reductase family protein [Knoellia sp.]